ncbi:hypothetical protein BDC45DRAFT_501173 [Circinella umbellata]|nr:hypothetical protein BDC45DRAFT_501173 [Circinella umbellata]
MCSENSSMTIVRCDLMHMNWSVTTIPSCYDYIAVGEASDTPSRCYLFDSGDTFKYGVVEDYEPTTSDIRRIDIYWKIDSILNSSLASISVPSITMELYTEGFSRWDPPSEDEMIPQQARVSRDMVLGNSRSSTSQNTTTTIFFTPNLYRAIRPRDPLSLLGFTPSYVEIPTLQATQLDWPLQQNENITRGDYNGLINIQLAKASLEVQTEQRQHTLLQAVALVGGAYGVLTTLYILLFGMIRIAPFGAAHQVPFLTQRGVQKIKERRRISRLDNNDNSSDTRPGFFKRIFSRHQPSQHLLEDLPSPGKTEPNNPRAVSSPTSDSKRDSLLSQHHQQEQQHMMLSLPTPALAPTASSSGGRSEEGSSQLPGQQWEHQLYQGPSSNIEQISNSSMHSLTSMPQDPQRVDNVMMAFEQMQREQRDTAAKAAQLEQRLLELQEVLRGYYINMDYLDQQRNMRRRARQRTSYYDKQSNNVEGGWLFDDDDDDDDLIHKNNKHR